MEGFVVFLIIVGVIGYQIFKAIDAAEKKRKEEEFKHTNPEAYVRLKQIEHERQMMAHDEKRMHHQNVQTGANIFANIFRSLFS